MWMMMSLTATFWLFSTECQACEWRWVLLQHFIDSPINSHLDGGHCLFINATLVPNPEEDLQDRLSTLCAISIFWWKEMARVNWIWLEKNDSKIHIDVYIVSCKIREWVITLDERKKVKKRGAKANVKSAERPNWK